MDGAGHYPLSHKTQSTQAYNILRRQIRKKSKIIVRIVRRLNRRKRNSVLRQNSNAYDAVRLG